MWLLFSSSRPPPKKKNQEFRDGIEKQESRKAVEGQSNGIVSQWLFSQVTVLFAFIISCARVAKWLHSTHKRTHKQTRARTRTSISASDFGLYPPLPLCPGPLWISEKAVKRSPSLRLVWENRSTGNHGRFSLMVVRAEFNDVWWLTLFAWR